MRSERARSRRHARIAAASLCLFWAAPATAEPLHWSDGDARALAQVISRIADDGLNPRDYAPDALGQAIADGRPAMLDRVANRSFRRLAADLWAGHVRPSTRTAWHVAATIADDDALDELTAYALKDHAVASALDALSPQNADYRALKSALRTTPASDSAARLALRVNMERWRWLPRAWQSRYLLVNVPSFTADLVEDGGTTASHRVIVGKPTLPTPQFSTVATGVIFNPWWDVPPSIIAESVGALVRRKPAIARSLGYEATSGAGGIHVRQRPGPANALGQMKLVMPNPFSVYLHDTPSKALFEKPVRAFSHGCIRVDRPLDLAAAMLASAPGWSRAAIDATIASGASVRVELAAPLPVYIVYFTMRANAAGQLVGFPDIYQRDAPIAAALRDGGGEGSGD